MMRSRLVSFALVILAWHGTCQAGPISLVPGYTLTKVSPDIPPGAAGSLFRGISQLTFNPGDNSHLYAARSQFEGSSFTGEVTRYDYDATSGALSNPLDVATNLAGPQGLAFDRSGNLYVSINRMISQPNGVGGIERLSPTGGGRFGGGVEFINNIPIGDHLVDQLQIRGNSLYVGIGTKTNTGNPAVESPYNGTISRIADLTRADYSAAGANNLPLASVPTDRQAGKLDLYATGFRNPFGLRVDASGKVSVTDNGADRPFLTPDYLYTNVPEGAKGLFPPGNGGTFQPLVNLGLDTSATGFDTIPSGSQTGKLLVALFAQASSGSAVMGQQLVAVDPSNGGITPLVADTANPTLFNPLDVIQDPFGRILIADYGPSTYSFPFYSTADVGVYVLTAVPEPSTSALWAVGFSIAAAGCLARRARRDGGSARLAGQ